MDGRAPLRRRPDGRPAGALVDRVLYAFGNVVVYGPLRNVLGMSRLRVAYTGGAAIGPDLFGFYRSIGINIKQLYGQTETCAYVCKQQNGEVRLDTVGKPVAGVDAADRRQRRGAGPLAGPVEGVLQASRGDGRGARPRRLVHDRRRRLRRRPRPAQDHRSREGRRAPRGRPYDGALFAPKYIENKLKFYPYIKEAVAFGNGRDHVLRVHQHRRAARSATGPSAATSRTPATPSWPASPRSTT